MTDDDKEFGLARNSREVYKIVGNFTRSAIEFFTDHIV